MIFEEEKQLAPDDRYEDQWRPTASTKECKQFLTGKYEWEEDEERIVKEIRHRVSAPLSFYRQCNNSNKNCLFWQAGICLARKMQCEPANDDADRRIGIRVNYVARGADEEVKEKARKVYYENQKLKMQVESLTEQVEWLRYNTTVCDETESNQDEKVSKEIEDLKRENYQLKEKNDALELKMRVIETNTGSYAKCLKEMDKLWKHIGRFEVACSAFNNFIETAKTLTDLYNGSNSTQASDSNADQE